MSGIFGVFHRTGRPVSQESIEKMAGAMPLWGRDRMSTLLAGPLTYSTPECRFDHMPQVHSERGIAFTAAGRVDNREELGRSLDIPTPQLGMLPDTDLMLRAYLCWGERCLERIQGDWAFAAWHPEDCRLFLARDPYGMTSLYYYSDAQILAFASSREALFALGAMPITIDELYVAQLLLLMSGRHGERTAHSPVRRLPPAHHLTATADRLNLSLYWRMEDIPELLLRDRREYVEGLLTHFDEAVKARIRVPEGASLASTLSGGLDSGAVTSTAASLLAGSGVALHAFTSVPRFSPATLPKGRFGDELPLAEMVAARHENLLLHVLSCDSTSPVKGLRRLLEVLGEPAHAAGNAYWVMDLHASAQAIGSRALLVGQLGNLGPSWFGSLGSQDLATQWRHGGIGSWALRIRAQLKWGIKRSVPPWLVSPYRQWRFRNSDWHAYSAIHPDLAAAYRDVWIRDAELMIPPALGTERIAAIKPGRFNGGALGAEMGAAHGLEVRDPTMDLRVLAFSLSIPDKVFIDPHTGLDRWVFRTAMAGRLPDEIRLNRNRGLQAWDIVLRLRACAEEVETTLESLATGLSSRFVDVPRMRVAWDHIRKEDNSSLRTNATNVLCRGLMVGLFVNGFGGRFPRATNPASGLK